MINTPFRAVEGLQAIAFADWTLPVTRWATYSIRFRSRLRFVSNFAR